MHYGQFKKSNNTMDVVSIFCALGVWSNALKDISLFFSSSSYSLGCGMADDVGRLTSGRMTHHSFVCERMLQLILPLNGADVGI